MISRKPVRVLVADAAGAAAADAAAISSGVPSRALMQRAGAAAASEIARRFPELLLGGVLVVTGAGNNGGDGWVVAASLHAVGVRVLVVESAESRTPDASVERALALAAGVPHVTSTDLPAFTGSRLVVDAVLGTGLRADAPLTGRAASGVACLHALQRHGALVVALDVPSGLDASSGLHVGAPTCAMTLTFGTIKRGHLVARERCGAIVVLDIGLGAHAESAHGHVLATDAWFRGTLPKIAADVHKGTRGRIAIIGGAHGMAGAVVLAARAALRSGAGLVKCVVSSESLVSVQEAEPSALAAPWPEDDAACASVVGEWADAVLIGPGLGREHRALVERVLRAFSGPVVLDADALNAFANDAASLAPLLRERRALLTPHPAEFARLMGIDPETVLEERFDLPHRLATVSGATVLLKGVPTVLSAPSGESMVAAEGTPILATGGAGDILGGIAATLLAHTGTALDAGALAAFAHGRAAAQVSARDVRGYALDDVLRELASVWSLNPTPHAPPVLYELPAVGEPA